MIIGIDPGHGGTNIGCAGCGLHEEVLTLQTALQLQTALNTLRPSWPVLLTRTRDETLHFATRAERLQRCDFVLSLHYDSSPEPSAGHMACYTFADDVRAEDSAQYLLQVAPPPLRPPNVVAALHHVNAEDWTVRAYNVLVHHRPKPCLLVEVGFLTNPQHVAVFGTTAGMSQTVAAIASALVQLERTAPTPSLV